MDKGRYYRKGERAAARPFHPEVGTRQNMWLAKGPILELAD
jgi:hypothetical protein